MYNSVHCVTNFMEGENEFKHKNDSYVLQPLYSIVASNMTRMHVETGSSFMTDTIETAVYPY